MLAIYGRRRISISSSCAQINIVLAQQAKVYTLHKKIQYLFVSYSAHFWHLHPHSWQREWYCDGKANLLKTQMHNH